MKKVVSFLSILLIFLTSCQKNVYNSKVERQAVQMAYKLLELYYPADELCVSDSIYALEWPTLPTLNNEMNDIIEDYTKSQGYIKGRSRKAPQLKKIFPQSACKGSNYKNIAKFSKTFEYDDDGEWTNIFRCDVVKTENFSNKDSCQIDSFYFISQGETKDDMDAFAGDITDFVRFHLPTEE